MKRRLFIVARAIHSGFEGFIKIFNLGFFAVSVVLWLVLAVQTLSLHGLDPAALWNAFNKLYDTFAFKVGCIFLIIFNGLGTIKSFLSQYSDLAEGVQHGGRVIGFLRKVFGFGRR